MPRKYIFAFGVARSTIGISPFDGWQHDICIRTLQCTALVPSNILKRTGEMEQKEEKRTYIHNRVGKSFVRSFNSMVLYPIHISIRKLIKLLWNCLYLDFDKPTDACLFSSHTHTRIIANSNTLHEIFMENYVFCLKYVYGFGFVLFSIPEYHIP